MNTANKQSPSISDIFFEYAAAFMVVIARDGSIIKCNPSFTNWLHKSVIDTHFPKSVVRGLIREQDKNANHFHTFYDDKLNRLTCWKVAKNDGDELFITGADITVRAQRERNLREEANSDALTKIMNRRGFLTVLRAALNNKANYSLIAFDLDGFKSVNDTMGHSAGDEILTEVAKRVKECTRNGDWVARMGGDEFAILLHDNHSNDILVERLLSKLNEPYVCKGEMVDYISASIGKLDFNTSELGTIEASTLLNISDELMYQSKKQGKNRWSQRTLI
ncbi:GGDEF domain-containing protein [Vibrio coralliirubri]|uniref:GGDEF domain-containing protein n=1 Tax=Vibrio coralliirubri TaxID=1516159 RepID=UPI00228466FE|nr:GGDEF domain-containing protein [Vibrio coralliirubri]MCY9861548.1 GGDEF domain-containing protein [Vibrio coralliirubri]